MATIRRKITKKLRFEIFKRDAFSCQYCGRTPPNVTLEIDHMIPISAGGDNDAENLITSCFDCNRGKSSRELEAIPESVVSRKTALEEQENQAKEYSKWLNVRRRRQIKNIDSIQAIFQSIYEDKIFTDNFRVSIKTFLSDLSLETVQDAMEKAVNRISDSPDNALRYFCGICWKKIREIGSKV